MSVEAYGGRRMRDFSFSGSCSRIITDDGEEDIIKEDKNMWMEYDRCLQKIEDWTEAMEEDAIIIGHDAHSPKELERKLPAGFEGNKSL